MIRSIVDGVKAITGLASEYIEDPDKKIEFEYKAKELETGLLETVLNTTTVPWVDALVKILVTLNSLWRPMVGAMMTAFGAYAHLKGIDMDPAAHVIFDGAFPAWGASRHMNKKQQEDTRREVEKERTRTGLTPKPGGP